MRNPDEERKDSVISSLEECGLSEQQVELAKQYLDGKTATCDLGVQTKLVYTAGSGASPRDQKLEKCVEKLEKHKENEMAGRYVELLFQIFGVSLMPLYYHTYGARKYVPEVTRIALEASHAYRGVRSILQITDDREVLRAAMKYTEKVPDGADFAILTAMFLDGSQGKAWDGKPIGTSPASAENKQAEKGVLGFLGNLLGLNSGNEQAHGAAVSQFETNVYAQKYPQEFQRYVGMFPELLPLLYANAIPPVVKQVMTAFLLEKDLQKPVPVGITNFTATTDLNDRKADYLIGSAAATYRLSPVIFQFLRIALSGKSVYRILDHMYAGVEYKKGVAEEMKRWRVDFGLNDVVFLHWLASKQKNANYTVAESTVTNVGKVMAYMTQVSPDAYLEAIKSANAVSYQVLVSAAKASGNNTFIQGKLQPLLSAERTNYRQKIIEEIMPKTHEGSELRTDCISYLTGTNGIEAALKWENNLSQSNGYQDLSRYVINYGATYGTDDFYARAVTFLGLRQMEYSILPFCGEGYGISLDHVKALLGVMASGGMPILQRLRVAAIIYESYRGKKEEKRKALEEYFAKELEEHREEALAAFLAAPVDGRLFGVSILNRDGQGNKEELLKYVGESSKQVKEELVKIYASHEDWLEDFLRILKTSKKSAERELAATVLANYKDAASHKEELLALIEQEKSKKVIDILRSILMDGGAQGAESAGGAAGGEQPVLTADAYVKECHKGGKKRGLAWIYETPMPEVHFKTGEDSAENAGAQAVSEVAAENAGDEVAAAGEARVASEEYLQAILLAYASMPIPGICKEVRILSDSLNKSELAAYVCEVYNRFMASGAEAKKKWVLYATSIHGGAKIVPIFQHQIAEWAENARGAIAAEAVKALALNDSPTALLIVDGMARKYKFKQVRKAAQDAMAFAAAQLGLSVEELADRIVPDLGFDERLERHFDYGTRSFTVRISPSLDIEVKDESGKKLKSLPAVGKSDDEAKATAALEEFKELKKQMKTTVKTQALRLELAMSLDRKWTAENWKKLFVKNPLMHQFAISLIWGTYKDGKLEQTFRYLEDGTFNTVEEEEYELSEDGLIGLVHPIELEKETIDAWKEQLSDYEITQAVEQLDRPVFKLAEEEKGQMTLDRFGGKLLNGLSLAGKLVGLGWNKGTPQDAGVYYSYWRKDVEAGYGAELLFSGAYVADENDEVTVYDAAFYKAEDVDKNCGYTFLKHKNDKMLKLGDVPVRYMSEILYQLTKATASSTETDEKWRDER
ncbi:MAG: DUF4132 domain-containing protein [Lachnospiraceae bacterium]|nr:DUF4132 domain-containing protein [Lachnospiraceae bacterium]